MTSSHDGSKNEPIAIVGIGCRFPGGATDLNNFWKILAQGKDVLSIVPKSRWDVEKYYDIQPGKPDKMYTKHGYFLSDVKQFDPLFFGISGREAAFMDPQQRLLLETGWEAVEQAGISMKSLQQKTTGIYIGCMNYDYAQLVATAENVDLHANVGTTTSALSGRLAHVFGLQGPVMTLDTACSSSLLAIHLACQSLRIGESEVALVGGVNLQLTPFTTVMECAGKMLSPDGRCKVFSDKADGFGRGDACAVVVLIRLSDALKEKLPIIALICGSAVNHDGSSGAMTVPNGSAQEAVIKQALTNASIMPEKIGYVEAHGTGTALGDPIEIQALHHVYGQNRSNDNPLWVGSVKANIGHTEAAAGLASLIKAALILKHKQLLPQLHFEHPSRKIAWDSMKIQINTSLRPWQRSDENYYAGVSSFGLSGTNVHLIIEAYENQQELNNNNPIPVLPLCLSAQTPMALSQMLEDYLMFLKTIDEDSYPSVAYTSCVGRVHFKYRLALTCSNKTEAITALSKLVSEKAALNDCKVPAIRSELMIVLPNHFEAIADAQLFNLPSYQEAIQASRSALDDLIKDNQLPSAIKASCNHFVHLYAYGRLLQALGLEPTLYLAEEVGLLVAAVLVGTLYLQDIPLLLKKLFVNKTTPPSEDIMSALEKISLQHPAVPIASVTTGQVLEFADATSFLALFKSSNQNELNVLLEGIATAVVLDPEHKILSKIKLDETKLAVYQLASATNDQKTSSKLLLDALVHLHLQGHAINWQHLLVQPLPRRILPTYPFQRDVYWIKEKQNSEWQFSKRITEDMRHYQQGHFFKLPDNSICYQLKFDSNSSDYWNHHRLERSAVLPGVFNIQVMIDFMKVFIGKQSFDISMLTFHRMAILSADNSTIFHATFVPESSGNWTFKSYIQNNEAWQLLASATLVQKLQADNLKVPVNITEVQNQWKKTVDAKVLYQGHQQLGYHLGEPFQWLSAGFYSKNETVRLIQHPDVQLADENLYTLYPGLIDACMQCYDSNGYESAMHVESNKIYVPFHIKKITFATNFSADEPAFAYAAMLNNKEDYTDSSIGNIVLFQKDRVVFQMEGVEYRKSTTENIQTSSLYQLVWQMQPNLAARKQTMSTIVVQMGGTVIEKCQNNDAFTFIYYPTLHNGSDATLKETVRNDLERILAQSNPPFRLVVCCPDDQEDMLTEASIKHYSAQYLRIMLSVLQEISKEQLLSLVIVTFKGQPVLTSDKTNPLQSMLWGMGRVIRHEVDYLQCHLVDLEHRNDLLWLIQQPQLDIEWQVAYRNYLGYVPRIKSVMPSSEQEFICHSDKSYLIFGGTGGLGISCCQLLAQKGATKIILVSRSGRLETTDLMDELQAMGVQLKLQSLDVLNQTAVANYLQELTQTTAIGGIIYAVGVINDLPLEKQTRNSFDEVILPKILGLWHVWTSINTVPLDFFVAYSSISSTWGSYGQSGYAAANSFIESFGQYVKPPYPFISIAWGPWSEVGLAARKETHLAPIFKQAGIDWIEPAQGNRLLLQALATQVSPIIVAHFDWEKHLKAMPEADSQTWLSSASTSREEVIEDQPIQNDSAITMPLSSSSAAISIIDICLGIVATVMKVSKQQIDTDQMLSVMGLDSVMALEISSAIHEQFGIEIPLVMLLENATVNWLAQHIQSQQTQIATDNTALIINQCIDIVATVMKLPKSQIDTDQMLNVMGLDSVMALEISSAIHEQFDLEIPLVMLLENASITWLANYIINTNTNTPATSHSEEIVEVNL